LIGDLDALCDAGLMGFRWEKGSRLYNTKQAGYDAVDSDFGASLIPESPALVQPTKEQPETFSMAQIFLCYAQEDEEQAEGLYQRLSDAGFKPWMAQKDLVGGERWKSRISQAIQRSDLFLACLSANSIDKRGWVQREIKDALDIWQEMLDSDIYLIPVRLEDCEVPESLREFHWVDLFEEDGWTRLVKAIQVGMERRAEGLTDEEPSLPKEGPERVLALETTAKVEPLTREEGCENLMDTDYIVRQLMTLVQLYELSEEATSSFHGTQHDQLVDTLNEFLFYHGPAIGIKGWGDNIQSMRDGGVDAVWNCHGQSASIKLGIQIKSPNDFERDEDVSFRRTVLAQIAESRQMDLSKLILGLCADLTSKSQREKCRGLLADIARMTDEYVLAIAPTKMAGIWRWSLGLQTEPLDQIREAGYAWLTAIYDSLGNLNQNSWGKGTGGGWSHPKTTTVRVGQQVLLSAIAISPVPEDIQYQFSVQRSGQSFEVRQDWSPNPNWTWNVVQADIGRGVVVNISVRRVKDYYQFNDTDDYTYAIYTVLPMKQN